MDERKLLKTERSVKAKNLRKASMDSFIARADPNRRAELMELWEPYYLKNLGNGKRAITKKITYDRSSREEKLEILFLYIEQSLKSIIKQCESKGKKADIETFRSLLKNGEFQTLFWAIEQYWVQQEDEATTSTAEGD
jgi:hypothetical protein